MPRLTEEQFEVKYQMYKEMLYNISYTYLKNSFDSEDLIQEVFLKYLKYDGNFESLDNEKYWLIRVTINSCKSFLTTAWKKNTILSSEEIERKKDQGIDTTYFLAISNLPNKYKEVIVLYYYENFKIEEIAQILKASQSAIKKRLQRAKEKLKEEIGNDRLWRKN